MVDLKGLFPLLRLIGWKVVEGLRFGLGVRDLPRPKYPKKIVHGMYPLYPFALRTTKSESVR